MNYESDEKPRYTQLSQPPEGHRHTFRVATGSVTVRYCETCGESWVLDGSWGWHWNSVSEVHPKAVEQAE